MKHYLIDSENVGDFWIPLLEIPADQAELIVFYTKNSPHMSYDSLIRLKESDRKVIFIKCYEGTNALDFQLCSELGYCIARNENDDFIIVTNDTGYDAAVKYWRRKEYSVKRIAGKDSRTGSRKKGNLARHDVAAEVSSILHKLVNAADSEETGLSGSGQHAESSMGSGHIDEAEEDVMIIPDADESSDGELWEEDADRAYADDPDQEEQPAYDEEPEDDEVAEDDEEPEDDEEAEDGSDEDTQEDPAEVNEAPKEEDAVTGGHEAGAAGMQEEPDSALTDAESAEPEAVSPGTDGQEESETEPEALLLEQEVEQDEIFTPDREELTAIVNCIGTDNLAELHNQLIQFYGDNGKDIYQSIKSGTAAFDKLDWSKEEKFLYYCALILRHSEEPEEALAEENIREFAQFLLNAESKRKNLNSLRYALLKHYGKEKGRRYYFMLKPYVKALNQM